MHYDPGMQMIKTTKKNYRKKSKSKNISSTANISINPAIKPFWEFRNSALFVSKITSPYVLTAIHWWIFQLIMNSTKHFALMTNMLKI